MLAALATGVLAGCGFRLRGSAELPFRTLYTTFAPNSPIGTDFRRMARAASGTTIVDQPKDAEAQLIVLGEWREKEILGFSVSGRPREYELRLRLSFRVTDAAGRDLLPTTTQVLRRTITASDVNQLAKEQEEVLIYREMQQDMVQQLLRRLESIRPPKA